MRYRTVEEAHTLIVLGECHDELLERVEIEPRLVPARATLWVMCVGMLVCALLCAMSARYATVRGIEITQIQIQCLPCAANR